MLSALLELARNDRPLWLPDLREAFLRDPAARPLVFRLTLHDGTLRDFPCAVPRWETEEERRFAEDYLHACIYNILAANSGRELRLFFDTGDAELRVLYDGLETAFQLRETVRRGYGKVISIAGRIAKSYGGGRFCFAFSDLRAYEPLPETPGPDGSEPLDEKLRALCRSLPADAGVCGIDVGGTDIKAALALGDELVCTKEYDWNPEAYATAEEIIEPILLLTRLMRACLHGAAGRGVSSPAEALLREALKKTAPLSLIRSAVEEAERLYGADRSLLAGVGLSFPDIVIGDRILGGETPKTDGMRRNASVDYEAAFARISDLKNELLALCKPGGQVRITNDGSMAAFTAAAELAHSADAARLAGGVVAHSLGTDLGTGWVRADGTIPALPLELYDLILDLGSFRSRAYPPEDLRSTRNENSGLVGARRYMGQAAAYRLACKLDPSLLEGFTVWDGDRLCIATSPQDLRKPCLEHLMQRAEEGAAPACQVFLGIGANLAVTAREMEYLLHPGVKLCFLFGRFVKRPGVFRLLDEGFRGCVGDRLLIPSDENLAMTPLMRALAERPDVTVAQFGQAVGAIYFALT